MVETAVSTYIHDIVLNIIPLIINFQEGIFNVTSGVSEGAFKSIWGCGVPSSISSFLFSSVTSQTKKLISCDKVMSID